MIIIRIILYNKLEIITLMLILVSLHLHVEIVPMNLVFEYMYNFINFQGTCTVLVTFRFGWTLYILYYNIYIILSFYILIYNDLKF